MQSMFEALLRIARLQNGPQGPTQRIDFTALLEDAVELLRPAAEDRGQALEADITPGLALQGDRDLLFQIAINLLDNAIKFAPRGGHIVLDARRPETRSRFP